LSIYMSRAELEEISEGLITAYANKFSNRVIQSIDIEHFITEFLMLRIEYASFAEDDAGRIGFLADGATPLLIHQDGKIIPFVFPKDTIVLDKFLLAEKEQGRRRFTMAHEASHHILSKMYAMPSEGRFHAEYDSERSYSKEELAQMFASVEWQADTMGASLLMPRRIIENALAKYNQSNPIKVYGDNTITSKDKAVIRRMAAYIGVSYTALSDMAYPAAKQALEQAGICAEKIELIIVCAINHDCRVPSNYFAHKYDIPVYISKKERDYYSFNCANLITLNENQVIDLGQDRIECLLTSGHTHGSMCYLTKNSLFSGDTLFIESCGATDFPGGSVDDLYDSIEFLKHRISDEIMIFPGHKIKTDVGKVMKYVKEHNVYFQIEDKEMFAKIKKKTSTSNILFGC